MLSHLPAVMCVLCSSSCSEEKEYNYVRTLDFRTPSVCLVLMVRHVLCPEGAARDGEGSSSGEHENTPYSAL